MNGLPITCTTKPIVSLFCAACAGVATALAEKTNAVTTAIALKRARRLLIVIFSLSFFSIQAMLPMSKVETCFNSLDFSELEQFDPHRLQR